MEKAPFEGWVILELMGHRRLAGYLSEQEIGGSKFIRIDVPGETENVATQFYSGPAVYCITPTTEAIARKVAKASPPAPVARWELREERALPAAVDIIDRDDDDDDDGYDEAELHGAGEAEADIEPLVFEPPPAPEPVGATSVPDCDGDIKF